MARWGLSIISERAPFKQFGPSEELTIVTRETTGKNYRGKLPGKLYSKNEGGVLEI